MRILQIIQKDQPRGAEIFATQLASHLRDLGHQVRIVSLFRYQKRKKSAAHQVALWRPLILRFFDPFGWWLLNKEIRRFSPDIIQANAGDTLKFLVFSKIFFSWNGILIYRNANLMSNFTTSNLKKKFNSWLLNKCDHIISVSPMCSIDLAVHFNVPEIKRSTIEIGIEEKSATALDASIQSFISAHPIITHIGSFVPEKNHFGLLRIFSLILQKVPAAKLVLIGDGSLRNSIQEKVEAMGVSDSLYFAGVVEDVYPILKASNLFLMPSMTEGIPAVILEAMYCGCPVVAYRVGGIPDLIAHAETGYLVDPGQEEQMADLAVKILGLELPEPMARIRKKAFQLVRDHYLNAQIALRFEKTYLQLIEIAKSLNTP